MSPIFGRGEGDLPDQVRPARNVERDAGQRLVHRQVDAGVAGDALLVAQRLGHGLAEHDAGILGRVVEVDVQVALGLERDVDQGVAGELLQHVVEEADAGRDVIGAGAVEIDGGLDLGLLGGALDGGLPLHGNFALLAWRASPSALSAWARRFP